jgi:hypothetical protein
MAIADAGHVSHGVAAAHALALLRRGMKADGECQYCDSDSAEGWPKTGRTLKQKGEAGKPHGDNIREASLNWHVSRPANASTLITNP